MPKQKTLLNTNTQVFAALKDLVSATPERCALHEKKIEKISDTMIRTEGTLKNLVKQGDKIYKTVFDDNGEKSLVNNMAMLLQRQDNHEVKHDKAEKLHEKRDKKKVWIMTQVITIFLGLATLIFGLYLSYQSSAKEEKALQKLKNEIVKEYLSKP